MTDKDLSEHRKQVKELCDAGNIKGAHSHAKKLIAALWKEKDFKHIAEVYHWTFLNKANFRTFETAYSLADSNYVDEAENIYGELLTSNPRESSVLNNLHIIKKQKGKIDEAWNLISKAYEFNPNDEIIKRNYTNLSEVMEERRQTDQFFRAASQRLNKENDFVIEKLRNFIMNVKKDSDFKGMMIPIANWKFRTLIQTDAQKADSLRDQWIERGYIRRTGERGNYNEYIYQINPYLDEGLRNLKKLKVPQNWMDGLERINADALNGIRFFDTIEKIQKVRKRYRVILERDVGELAVNYLMANYKSVIVMSGSLVETLLIYYCEKKKIRTISYSRNQRNISKNIYEADLGDLLSYFQEQGILGDLLVHMGNISRISRNFIHPGKELRDTEELSQAKANMCYLSALEILNAICAKAT